MTFGPVYATPGKGAPVGLDGLARGRGGRHSRLRAGRRYTRAVRRAGGGGRGGGRGHPPVPVGTLDLARGGAGRPRASSAARDEETFAPWLTRTGGVAQTPRLRLPQAPLPARLPRRDRARPVDQVAGRGPPPPPHHAAGDPRASSTSPTCATPAWPSASSPRTAAAAGLAADPPRPRRPGRGRPLLLVHAVARPGAAGGPGAGGGRRGRQPDRPRVERRRDRLHRRLSSASTTGPPSTSPTAPSRSASC